MSVYKSPRAGPDVISLRLSEISQLFNSLDPSPFIARDLDPDAEDFIVRWARELSPYRGLKLVINLAEDPPSGRAAEAPDAVRHHFEELANSKLREFHQLMRRGRISLVIGLLFLGVCLAGGNILERLGGSTFWEVLKEGFLICGWVAMWRPLEIYLYDWWPLRAEWRIFQRLCHMEVELVLPK